MIDPHSEDRGKETHLNLDHYKVHAIHISLRIYESVLQPYHSLRQHLKTKHFQSHLVRLR